LKGGMTQTREKTHSYLQTIFFLLGSNTHTIFE
jgi:hypothetical protein